MRGSENKVENLVYHRYLVEKGIFMSIQDTDAVVTYEISIHGKEYREKDDLRRGHRHRKWGNPPFRLFVV